MAMEFQEFSTIFINVVKANNIDKAELGSIMLAITVADSISDSSSRSEFTPAMLLSRSDDNYWDSLVHTLGLDNTKQAKENNHIDIIKKKRLLCDTLMLFGVQNENKILTIPASKTVFPNKQFSTKRTQIDELTGKTESALETDENVVDSIMKGFATKDLSDSNIEKAYLDIINILINTREDFTFTKKLYLNKDLYDKTKQTGLSGYELESEDKQTDQSLVEAIYELNENFIIKIHSICKQNPRYSLLLLSKYIDEEDKLSVYIQSRIKILRQCGRDFVNLLDEIAVVTEVNNIYKDYNKISKSAVNLAELLYVTN